MGNRTTHLDVKAVFCLLCRALGKKVSTGYDDKGAWTLDYAACYGGWVIHENSVGGGVSLPMGDLRYHSREFVQMMHYAMRALGHVTMTVKTARKVGIAV